ncbi:uncharacterized protein LOC128987543 [Macrosteles quadrilineatus]|uniref:uncharacterized protein LOC128987543 n=1 Tax=Macrosteles quadrilineatus TaxID=74068 RepID=UPI0023E13062|nr:uncharacterized protein LOC128987543 [Macrosteles quadrilineatus]
MEARLVFLDVILVVLLTLNSRGEADSYEAELDLTKETWDKVQKLGDITKDVETLLNKYNGNAAENCVKQLPQQNYRSALDKKLASYKSKLDYNEKLLQGELQKCGTDEPCKEEVMTKYEQNMDAVVTNANVYIPGLKTSALNNLQKFMDSCVQGTVVKDESRPVPKSTRDQENYDSEVGDQWHW